MNVDYGLEHGRSTMYAEKNAKTGLDTRETRHADGGLGRKDDLGSVIHTVVNNYPGEHWPPMPLRVPPNYNIYYIYIYKVQREFVYKGAHGSERYFSAASPGDVLQ